MKTAPGASAPLATLPVALAVFANNAGLWWLRFLKPGFRHCFAVLPAGGGRWIVCDPRSDRTEIAIIDGGSLADVAARYLSLGATVAPWPLRPSTPLPQPWRPFTCVEVVKRALGIRAGAVATPWWLFRYMIKHLK